MEDSSLIISFPTTDKQKEILKQFCKDKLGCDAIIAVSQTIAGRYLLSLSVFEHRPEIYIGVLSLDNNTVLTDVKLTDEEIKLALRGIDFKYAFATSRKSPIANRDIVMAWIDYINNGIPKEKIPL